VAKLAKEAVAANEALVMSPPFEATAVPDLALEKYMKAEAVVSACIF
jgi:hypothetical protein